MPSPGSSTQRIVVTPTTSAVQAVTVTDSHISVNPSAGPQVSVINAGPQGPYGNGEGPGGGGFPPGTFITGGWTTDPAGALLMTGYTIIGGAITYPNLASLFPSWVSGSDLLIPDATGAVPLATNTTPGVVAGSMDKSLSVAQLPPHNHDGPEHTHSNDHDHPSFNTGSGGGHDHNAKFRGFSGVTTSPTGWFFGRPHANTGHDEISRITDTQGPHAHAINVPNFTGFTGPGGVLLTSNTGSGNPVDVTPKNISARMAVVY